eukprot:TRINITY_DN495_c0_g1_i2.p1 TRINITY_DN495_c0_g1~~TRINITY_DN495_c0_g1_i2.p1  ORF type:complete len:121 (+),score=19.20 TRINITY_DN495_c0_g1_i2:56-418(+)
MPPKHGHGHHHHHPHGHHHHHHHHHGHHVHVVHHTGPVCHDAVHVLKGAWKNTAGADVTLIDQVGHTITCTNASQAWSPAVGEIRGSVLTFRTGMPGLMGTLQPGHRRITFSNGCSWDRV